MAEGGTATVFIRKMVAKAEPYIPQVPKPKKKFAKLKYFGILALGLLIYSLVGMIPYIGWLIHFVLFIIGVGAFMMMKKDYYVYLKKKNMV